MKSANIFKKVSVSFASLLAGLMLTSGVVHAIPYQGDQTVASPVPAFNVFTGNMPAPAPLTGENDFYQGRAPANNNLGDTSTKYVDPVGADCTDGTVLQMRVYIHNGADAAKNNNGTGPSVAHNTKVRVDLPTNQATSFHSTASISASNAATVSDGLSVNCNGQSVKLQYVPGSASQYSLGTGTVPLSDAIVGSGVSVRSEKVAGDVWGCWNERVYVLLAVKVVKPTPPPVQVTATCDLLSVVAGEERKVKVSQFKYTSLNASVKNVVLNWGDNSGAVTLTDASKVVGLEHQYAKDSNYTISAVITFTDNTTQKAIVSGGAGTACVQQVSYTTPNQPPTIVTPPTTTTTTSTPAAPTELVNTGAGSIMGIFAATAAAGSLAYRYVTSRRLSRQ